jgi:hypothetical protein
MATHSNVVVNLNISANASGTIDVFGQATTPTITGNILVASNMLPVSDLYVSSSNSLIKFQGSNNDILATRDSNFSTTQETFVTDLNTIINGSFNCLNASPFSLARYSNVYNTQSNFGYVALGYYANQLFGHVAATAAIANDSSFITYMTSDGAGTANISSNLVSSIFSMSNSAATAIAKQVIGQDASRAMSQDNDLNAPNTYQALKWIAGDVIYMNVTLQPPTVTKQSGQLQNITTFSGNASYLLKITLGDNSGGDPPSVSHTYILTIQNVGGSLYVVPSFDGVALTFPVSGATWDVQYSNGPGQISFNGATGLVSGNANGIISSTYTFEGAEYNASVNYNGYVAAPALNIYSPAATLISSGATYSASYGAASSNSPRYVIAFTVKDASGTDITSSTTWTITNTGIASLYFNIPGVVRLNDLATTQVTVSDGTTSQSFNLNVGP